MLANYQLALSTTHANMEELEEKPRPCHCFDIVRRHEVHSYSVVGKQTTIDWLTHREEPALPQTSYRVLCTGSTLKRQCRSRVGCLAVSKAHCK